jgi:UDP-glucuronate 4-epimerase
MEFLITGCAGFIGSHFSELILKAGGKVIGVDNFDELLYGREIKEENLTNLLQFQEFEFKSINMIDLELKDKELVVINFAALAGQRYSWNNLTNYFNTNTFSPLQLFEKLSRNNSLHRFIQISTSSVYGLNATSSEDGRLNPISPYGISKLAAEQLLQAHIQVDSSVLSIFRLFSVYGPRQRPDMAYSRIIDCLIYNKPFHLFGTGLQSRTNTYVDDVCELIFRSINFLNLPTVMNIGGIESCTLLEAIAILEEISGKKLEIKHESSEVGDQVETRAQLKLAREYLGYKPVTSIQKGLQKQFDFAAKIKK